MQQFSRGIRRVGSGCSRWRANCLPARNVILSQFIFAIDGISRLFHSILAAVFRMQRTSVLVVEQQCHFIFIEGVLLRGQNQVTRIKYFACLVYGACAGLVQLVYYLVLLLEEEGSLDLRLFGLLVVEALS